VRKRSNSPMNESLGFLTVLRNCTKHSDPLRRHYSPPACYVRSSRPRSGKRKGREETPRPLKYGENIRSEGVNESKSRWNTPSTYAPTTIRNFKTPRPQGLTNHRIIRAKATDRRSQSQSDVANGDFMGRINQSPSLTGTDVTPREPLTP